MTEMANTALTLNEGINVIGCLKLHTRSEAVGEVKAADMFVNAVPGALTMETAELSMMGCLVAFASCTLFFSKS